MNNLVYFVPGLENVTKRKHLLFLQKSGFTIVKVTDLEALPERVENLKPAALILNDEEALKDILLLIGELPVIVLTKTSKNIQEIMSSLPATNNIIFFRTEADPIDSLLETISLCDRIYGKEKLDTK